MQRHTVLFLTRWFLIRRVNQSREVDPVLYLSSGSFATASAMIELSSDRGRRIIELPGRVKKTKDQRSNLPCSFGGGLRAQSSQLHVGGPRKKVRTQPYTTRCRFERRMPPLKIARASPTLQIACPGIGYKVPV